MPAKWQDVTIPAGQMESQDIDIPHELISVPPGKVRAGDGSRFKGNERPRFTVVEPTAGQSRIVLNEASDKDLVFKVKAEDDAE